MTFVPKTFNQILYDMITYVKSKTNLTDINVGSVLRTILEAAALEDEEQYYQMVKLLELFYLDTTSGEDLDKRVRELSFDTIVRMEATKGVVPVVFIDERVSSVVKSTLVSDVPAGSTSVELYDAGSFPPEGEVIFDRGEPTRREKRAYTKNGNILSVSPPLSYSHLAGSYAILSVLGYDIVFPVGTEVLVPATYGSEEIVFSTTEEAIIYDGDRESLPVEAQCTEAGSKGKIGSYKITEFKVLPFPTARVENRVASVGASDRETDEELRKTLSRATELALENAVKGVSIPSGQRVVDASVQRTTTPGVVYLYIDDGTGFIPTTVDVDYEVLTSSSTPGRKRFRLSQFPIKENSEHLWRNGNLIIRDVDYRINYTTGDIEIINGLSLGDTLVASGLSASGWKGYTYYNGLIQEVQKVVNGLQSDRVKYPGYKSCGDIVYVKTPNVQYINVIASISAEEGYTESMLYDTIKTRVEQYINSLRIGETVYVAKLIERIMSVDGVKNVVLSSPSSDIVVSDDTVVKTDKTRITLL